MQYIYMYCMYVYICVYICTHIYIYTCTYIYSTIFGEIVWYFTIILENVGQLNMPWSIHWIAFELSFHLAIRLSEWQQSAGKHYISHE